MQLENDSAEPLYIQLADIIRGEIENGVYSPEQRIPTEKELSELYGVSRITIRNALEILTRENRLIRRRGKGTFIASRKLSKSMSELYSFTDICRINGMKPGSKTIKCVLEEATEEDAADLNLQPEERVIVLERIRYADGVPVSVEISRYPAIAYGYLLEEDLTNESLFSLLKNKYNVQFSRSTKVIEVKRANFQLAAYLHVSKDYPLLSISSITYDGEGRPSHRTQQYIDSERFKLVV